MTRNIEKKWDFGYLPFPSISKLSQQSPMEVTKSQSIFQDIKSRELSGFRATSKAVFIAHGGEETSPLAVSFSKTIKSAHILAMSDEDGYWNDKEVLQKLGEAMGLPVSEGATLSDLSVPEEAENLIAEEESIVHHTASVGDVE
ncbi:hypothetical protein Dimus_027073, partial [Dionaea muscipula]